MKTVAQPGDGVPCAKRCALDVQLCSVHTWTLALYGWALECFVRITVFLRPSRPLSAYGCFFGADWAVTHFVRSTECQSLDCLGCTYWHECVAMGVCMAVVLWHSLMVCMYLVLYTIV